MFILFDPIFWINKTLATFDRMIAKLQKHVEKCEKEAARNVDSISAVNHQADTEKFRAENKAFRKIANAKKKANKKSSKISLKRDLHTGMLAERNKALDKARSRAINTSKNLNKLMEG